MAFCYRCGAPNADGTPFCGNCGAPFAQQQPTAMVPTPMADPTAEEQEFLDVTHRLLRWEMKAWNIAAKAFLIGGIVFAGLFFTLGLIFALSGEYYLEIMAGAYIAEALILGGMFVALGIVSKKAAERIPQYIDSVYTDLRLAHDRCGNVGMLVFSVLLGVVSPIFFIINFVRMKANKDVIARIIARQQGQF